ncbi:MAG: MBL fold metallo-hydrolase [Candidatus Heimdallarchaeota archaeon]|nr:MBL fold metallo-hydrolase [Candidatus Heimdallarchaeota archaeon]
MSTFHTTPDYKITEITENIILCTDLNYFDVNMICIKLTEDVLFVDTGMTKVTAKEFKKMMMDRYNTNKSSIVITHSNGDHFAEIAEFQDSALIISDKFISRFEKQYETKFEDTDIQAPIVIFHDDYEIGDQELIFRVTGGHTNDSMYIHLPKERILIAGDNLIEGWPQYFLHYDSDLEVWIKVLTDWEGIDFEYIIPGHGKPVGKDYMIKVREYLEIVHSYLIKCAAAELPLEKVLENKKLLQYFEKDPENWIEKGITNIYKNYLS